MKKFNWIDAVIILLVIAIGVGGYWFLKVRPAQQSTNTQNVKIYVTVEMRNVQMDVVNAYKEAEKEGRAVTLGTTNVDTGVVTKVEYRPYTEDIEDFQTGEFKVVEFEGEYIADITIAVPGTETETCISSPNEAYRIGEEMIFHGKGIAGDGYIVGVSTEKEAE